MPDNTIKTRYDAVSVTLHWGMALAFILMLGSGLTLEFYEGLSQSLKFSMIQWHKSLGVILLVLFFVRIGWRLFHSPPRLPDGFPLWDKIAAKAGHWGLYALMFAMPFTGWVMVSSSSYGLPTIVFGWFEWPHIPGIAGDRAISGAARQAHGILGWVFVGLIVLHVAAVFKHLIFDRENLLKRMSFRQDK